MASFTCHVVCAPKRRRLERIVRQRPPAATRATAEDCHHLTYQWNSHPRHAGCLQWPDAVGVATPNPRRAPLAPASRESSILMGLARAPDAAWKATAK